MGRDRQQAPGASSTDAALAHRPFSALKQLVVAQPRRAAAAVEAPKRAAPVPTQPPPDDASLFRQAVAGVKPLDPRERERVDTPPPAAPARTRTDPDAEALAELCDLVAGTTPFDLSDSDEYVEGAMVGVDARLLRRLRSGDFALQGHIDLHGMTTEEARPAVDRFLAQAHVDGKRCVLIVHGRGRNSKDQIPVLKRSLVRWLARGQSARQVLAFTSARPCDGGAGAVYVLLRRLRHVKRPIRVTEGAKR